MPQEYIYIYIFFFFFFFFEVHDNIQEYMGKLHFTLLNYTIFYTFLPKLSELTLALVNYENLHFSKQISMRWGAKCYIGNSLRG